MAEVHFALVSPPKGLWTMVHAPHGLSDGNVQVLQLGADLDPTSERAKQLEADVEYVLKRYNVKRQERLPGMEARWEFALWGNADLAKEAAAALYGAAQPSYS